MAFVFLALALVGLLFLAISMFGGDHDVGHDGDTGHGGPGLLSVRGLAVFLTTFGAVGGASSLYLPVRSGRGLVSSSLGLISGALMMGVYVLTMRMVYSQQASSLVGDRDLLGVEARVTVAIPENGVGEVSCHLGGQTARRMARALGPKAIPEGSAVRIKDVYGATVVVEPVG